MSLKEVSLLIVGALITFFTTLIINNRQNKKEDKKRIEFIFGELVQAISKIETTILEDARARWWNVVNSSQYDEEQLLYKDFRKLISEIDKYFNQLNLIINLNKPQIKNIFLKIKNFEIINPYQYTEEDLVRIQGSYEDALEDEINSYLNKFKKTFIKDLDDLKLLIETQIRKKY